MTVSYSPRGHLSLYPASSHCNSTLSISTLSLKMLRTDQTAAEVTIFRSYLTAQSTLETAHKCDNIRDEHVQSCTATSWAGSLVFTVSIKLENDMLLDGSGWMLMRDLSGAERLRLLRSRALLWTHEMSAESKGRKRFHNARIYRMVGHSKGLWSTQRELNINSGESLTQFIKHEAEGRRQRTRVGCMIHYTFFFLFPAQLATSLKQQRNLLAASEKRESWDWWMRPGETREALTYFVQ